MSDFALKLAEKSRWLLIVGTTFLVIALVPTGVVLSYQNSYGAKIYRGVRIGMIDVSGLTAGQALQYLKGQAAIFNGDGIQFHYGGQEVRVKSTVNGASDLDISYDIFSFNLEETVAQAYRFGREGTRWQRLKDQSLAIFRPKTIPVYYTLDREALKDVLKSNFENLETPPQDAHLLLPPLPSTPVVSLASLGTAVSQARVEAHKVGKVFDYELAADMAAHALASLEYVPIGLSQVSKNPELTEQRAIELLTHGNLSQFIGQAPLKLVYKDKSWVITPKYIDLWLDFGKLDGQYTFLLKGKGLEDYLKKISKGVDVPAQDAKFAVKDGKVVEFQSGQRGEVISIDSTIARINKALQQGQREVALASEQSQPLVTSENVNNLGIKEIIGVGRSNFAGSPVNRRHNIRVGAAKLNGLLIKPGEDFSLLGALGAVSEETGYKEELVIKGNRTLPEFGGGLCQIGTTTFRAALDSGLPILERQNHSYRVVYYEPAGLDATIYIPRPDLKFTNDTGNYILIQTKIQGNDLVFEFWGTKDGRVAEHTRPKIYNVTPPPPMQVIESTDLKPGEKKCTERAHDGATTDFTYKVTYPDGEAKQQVFKSIYKPWQAVCLVGKDSTTATAPGDISAAPPLLSPDLPSVPPQANSAPAPANAKAPTNSPVNSPLINSPVVTN